ncbi:FHA domain-containing protein [Gemmata sp. JC673]|uniref:FHA domain-containing protein n=1 Tax=Gemmata algarum TaxID=2975278 RepID=A0ABU5ER18_9BACT|nr:FHA domain-containing protein [Gemmata algarum]MDY3557615.1 FHA domain-containing protein [Gemmata algarum]
MPGLFVVRDAWEYASTSSSKPLDRKWFPLVEDVTVIGRDPARDVVIPAIYIRRAEAKIVRENGAYYLESLPHSNATVFEDQVPWCHRTRRVLNYGDLIKIGQYEFAFLNDPTDLIVTAEASHQQRAAADGRGRG